MKRVWIIIVILLLLVVGCLFLYFQSRNSNQKTLIENENTKEWYDIETDNLCDAFNYFELKSEFNPGEHKNGFQLLTDSDIYNMDVLGSRLIKDISFEVDGGYFEGYCTSDNDSKFIFPCIKELSKEQLIEEGLKINQGDSIRALKSDPEWWSIQPCVGQITWENKNYPVTIYGRIIVRLYGYERITIFKNEDEPRLECEELRENRGKSVELAEKYNIERCI